MISELDLIREERNAHPIESAKWSLIDECRVISHAFDSLRDSVLGFPKIEFKSFNYKDTVEFYLRFKLAEYKEGIRFRDGPFPIYDHEGALCYPLKLTLQNGNVFLIRTYFYVRF